MPKRHLDILPPKPKAKQEIHECGSIKLLEPEISMPKKSKSNIQLYLTILLFCLFGFLFQLAKFGMPSNLNHIFAKVTTTKQVLGASDTNLPNAYKINIIKSTKTGDITSFTDRIITSLFQINSVNLSDKDYIETTILYNQENLEEAQELAKLIEPISNANLEENTSIDLDGFLTLIIGSN